MAAADHAPRTLADLQRDPRAPAPAAGSAGLPIAVSRTRTFDTPEFAGMTFLEVEAKSALNRVKGMPFPWSINPYRGCSHACSYCLAGDTPVLMADGRIRPIADLRPGDRIYGTRRQGRHRRFVPTEVIDHWTTRKPAYAVTLSDGTRLVASADHRFLTRHGWKHVTGTEQGAARRPHLTPNDLVPGTGRFPPPPKESAEYRRGYLCGTAGGDLEPEPLARTRRHLAELAGRGPGQLHDEEPSEDWCKGFLAGIFDADGACIRGVLRIANVDEDITRRVERGLQRLGFRSRRERQPNGGSVVRLVGGLSERMRFFLTVDPATTRKRTIDGVALKTTAPRRVASVEPLGTVTLFDITTGTGDFIADGVVSHNCFARPTHAYLNLSPLGDFERTVVVKTNVADVLRRELARPSWKGEPVAMGTNTDPYQRCEGRYRLMPGIIRALAESYTPFSVLTKGTLITRDLDQLRAAGERVPVTAALTIGMLDESVWHAAEPGTPSPTARLRAVRALNDAGIPTGVMLAPIMPGLNDDEEQLAALVDAAARAGAVHISPIVLHLRPGVRELFWPWLEATYPHLVPRYAELYRGSQARKEYGEAVQASVRRLRAVAWRRHGHPVEQPLRGGARAGPRPGGGDGEQLSLL